MMTSHDDKTTMSRLMPESAQNHLQSGAGRRSPLQYDDTPQQQQQQQQQQQHLLPPHSTFVVNSSDYHIASFTKPTPTTSYVQGSSVVYVLSPPPARSPPNIAPPLQQQQQQLQQLVSSGPSMSLLPGPSMAVSPHLDAQSSSFTNTFLRGILSSIDSKDPVVANAWFETLLDAIDILPPDVIKREIVVIAINKAQIEQTVNSRKAACRLLGKIGCKLDPQSVRQEILPVALALCQDAESEVRECMCCHLGLVARGVGADFVEATILPQLVDLGNDENCEVRLAAVETVVQLLELLDKDVCRHTIVPLVIKSCDRAKRLEDETLPKLAHHLGQLCHGLMANLKSDQKSWFINFFRHLAQLGLPTSRDNSLKLGLKNDPQPMPDLLPPMEANRSELHAECRLQCAFNFPAMVIFVGHSNFNEVLYPTFADLAADPSWRVRQTLARGLHEVAKLVGNDFKVTKTQVSNLFADTQIEVLEAMVSNMVHVIDALARHGVLQFAGQGGKYSHDLSRSLLSCEESISMTRNWRLQADCLEKFSCLANCISPTTIMQKFIPLLFNRIQHTRTLPCRVAAARTLLVILRFTVKVDDRSHIIFRIQKDLANGKSCHTRMLFLRLCEMAIALFSKQYFKRNFFDTLLLLAKDRVPNIRLKLCGILPRLKSLLSLPSDRGLLQQLEDTIKDWMLRETDTDVLFAVQKAIQDLDGVETGVDGVPSMNADEDRDNERKLREERLIASMEEQLYKSSNSDLSASSSPTKNYLPVSNGERLRYLTPSPPASSSTSPSSADSSSSRRRSESLPPPLMRGANSEAFSNLARQTPEPLRTYSSELSSSDKQHYSSSNNWTPKDFSQQPYSSSLENLDPSAKEFLVDAGVILDKSRFISTVSSSMPNLSKINEFLGQSESDRSTSEAGQEGKKGNLEGEFSKYLISNEEMEQYEAEYQRCANALASGNSDPASLLSGTGSPNSSLLSRQKPEMPQNRSREANNGMFSSTDKLMSISNMAQNTFSKIASSDKLQGSIERLAEKWEAKRKSLSRDSSNDELEYGGSSDRPVTAAMIEQNKLIAIKQQAIPNRRSLLKPPTGPSSTAIHKNLGGPTPTQKALLAKKRLSLTDHVGAVSQQAMQKLINRKSLNSNEVMLGYIETDNQDKNSSPQDESEASRRRIKMNGMRRFASVDDSKQDDNYPMYPDGHQGYTVRVNDNGGPPSYGSSLKTMGLKPRGNNNDFYYGSTSLSPTHGSNRTLPQPPRSLPMTPGSGPGPQQPQRMSFIPSKPFNNFLPSQQQQQQQQQSQSPLSSSAPATTFSTTNGRMAFSASSPTTSSTNASGSGYRQQQQQQQQQQQPGSSQQRPSYSNAPPRRAGLASNGVPQDSAPKTKIVSSYIVAVDSSPTSPENLSTASDPPILPKFSRMPQPRYRPQPQQPPAPPAQKRPVSATTTSSAPASGGRSRATSGILKQQKSISAESILGMDQNEPTVTSYERQNSFGSAFQRNTGNQSSVRRNGDKFQSSSETNSTTKTSTTPNNVRRSSGARMWQGQNVRQRSQEGRTNQDANLPNNLPPISATGTNRARARAPPGSQDQYESNGHGNLQRQNSYGPRTSTSNQGNSYQSKVVTGMRSRPSSIHSSPGSSRPGSPQTVGNQTGYNNKQPANFQQQQQQQQQPQQQQRRPLGTKTSGIPSSTPSGSGSGSFGSRMSQPPTPNQRISSMTSQQQTITSQPRNSSVTSQPRNSTATSQQFMSRRDTSAGSVPTSLPQPSTSTAYSSGSSRGSNYNYSRQPSQQQQQQGGLPTPGFSSRLPAQRQTK